MKRVDITLMISGTILIGIAAIIYMSTQVLDWQREQFNAKASWEKQKFELQLKETCQTLSATTVDPEWGYKSCIKELQLNKAVEKTL